MLSLLPGSHLTPILVEGIVRLSAHLPVEQIPPLIAHFTGVSVDHETARRLTEAAGAVQVTLETEAVDRIERTLPPAPVGAPRQLLRVDGAMVPLVGGGWSEVKTLAIGTVETIAADASVVITTRDLSYFSRLTDATSFNRLATVETHRRGTEVADLVVAVVDGARWCQSFIDHQRQDAVRILDFAHALEHLGAVAHSHFGPGTPAASDWLGQQAHALRHGQEQAVLDGLATLATTGTDEARSVTQATHAYLSQRLAQIHYQTFVAAGYPIGSGCVERANKLVVEARLKGSGMHWCREHVNPMLALRTAIANHRWDAIWPDLWTAWRQQARTRSPARRARRHACTTDCDDAQTIVEPSPALADQSPPPSAPSPPREKTIVNGKPTANHVWNRTSPFRAKR